MRIIKQHRNIAMLFILTLGLFVTSVALAQKRPCDNIVVFGGSLSDSGNAFVVLSDPLRYGFDEACNPGTPMNVPPYDSLDDYFIPDGTMLQAVIVSVTVQFG